MSQVPFSLSRPIEVLLVEDNPADILLTQEAFEEANFPHRLHLSKDGVEALEFLRQGQGSQDSPLPDVILLDLNMPRMNGHETLNIIKEDEQLRHIPVIVLTTSRAESDVWRSYNLRANSYIAKPVTITEFIEVIRSFESFWFTTAALPPKRRP